MIIYNVSVKTDHSIADAWVDWMKEEHIPEIIGTGCFTQAILARLIETDESEGITYVVQYYADSKALYNRYIREYAPGLRQKAFDRWGDRFIAFRSVMEQV
jgi:hypothetical protein